MIDPVIFKETQLNSLEEIKSIQNIHLQKHLKYCKDHSPFYRRIFKEHQIDIKTITPDTVSLLPITEKSDIEKNNDDFLAVSMDKIVDIVMSSGTTGLPTRIMYTESDLQRLAYNEETSLKGCGITKQDTVLMTCTMDRCFIAGLAYFVGLRKLGAAVIRNGQNTLESHQEMIKRLQPTVIIGVPGFLKKLGQFMKNSELDPAKTKIKKIVCIGEPLRNRHLETLKIGNDLEKLWQADIYSTYASSETVTTFCECAAGKGGHMLADLAIVEILDDNHQPLTAGNIGEIVVTPMAMEGMPLIRFKTGDISFITDEPCTCGRLTPRLGPILGRKKQMIKIRGTTLYPPAVFSVLEDLDDIEEYYLVVANENELSEKLSVHVAVNNQAMNSETLERLLQARLRVKPQVIIEDIKTIRQRVFNMNSRKPVRFFDYRNKSEYVTV